ncbi:hypothetical protein R1flu_013663 [Riccia fluitans]|uniref:F-box domain-containing protein n=1 Tax=Riccia fluitans TaxID=41844 RepID=A0ABD1YH22_9MARC
MDSSVMLESSDTKNHELGKVPWAELLADTLVEVFKWLPVKDHLLTLPQICKAWRKASCDPGCWRVVDLKEWCRDHSVEDIDRMVRVVVERSCGGIEDLRLAYMDGDASLQFLARSGLSSLKTLCIPGSYITENGLCELVVSLPSLAYLDISKCDAVTSKGLEFIGHTCKSLTRLDRVMWEVRTSYFVLEDSEAMAVAQNMPKLKHLEMSSDWVSNSSFNVIRASCKDLEVLEVVSADDDEEYMYWSERFQERAYYSEDDLELEEYIDAEIDGYHPEYLWFLSKPALEAMAALIR